MPRRRTSRFVPQNRSKVLQARIYTPRIVWFRTLRFFAFLTKWSFICGLLFAACYAVWDYGKKNFVENPNYELQVIKLSPNSAFNEMDIVALADIPLNKSIFSISLTKVEETLRARPEVTSVVVRRELPATISIDLTVRQPFAWVECSATHMQARSRERGFLIDREGYLYPCPPLQYDAAVVLPVIVVASEEASLLVPGQCVESKSMKRALRLLTLAERASKTEVPWIDSVQPYQPWAMKVWTRDGIEAIFGLEGHQQQLENLLLSMKHANEKGLHIASINLIPERNLPVTLRPAGSDTPRRVRPQGPASIEALGRP
jgi:cell division septal protein FtsQ